VKAVIQRVSRAEVAVAGATIGTIGPGLCVFLGIGKDDGESEADHLADKIQHLRIFDDDNSKMNRSVLDVSQAILVVSQFTLYADCSKGHRPSFSDAAPPEAAEELYEYFVERLRNAGLSVATGQFRTRMDVTLTNDGPVTFVLEI
jgi:D-tyrosyl-tRNA(Tyr) deacylase